MTSELKLLKNKQLLTRIGVSCSLQDAQLVDNITKLYETDDAENSKPV